MAEIEIIQPIPRKDPIVYIEKDELVEGGPEGAANRQAIAIANNLAFIEENTYTREQLENKLSDAEDSILNKISGLGDIVGEGDETAKFQSLLDTLPKNINLSADKTYTTTGKLYVKSSCVIDGKGASVICTAPISTPELTSSIITSLVKGETKLTVTDASKFSIFDDILIYFNEDNSDTWYLANQLNFDEFGITSQKNQVLGISGNTLTLKYPIESKLSEDSTKISSVFKIKKNQVIIKNVNFKVNSNYWVWLRCAGIRYEFCTFEKIGGTISGFSNQMCFENDFLNCEFGEGLSIGFNYGSYNCLAEKNKLYAGRSSDGLLITYAGSRFITSRDNKFLSRNKEAQLTNAGLYWGAKCRDCHSYNDSVVGLDYGFRVMFGAMQCSINNMTTKNIGTFSGFVSYSSVAINNFTGYDKPIRTINAEMLTIKGGFLFSSDKNATPILLDLNRNETSDIRKNYHIEGLYCEGIARAWLGVNDLKLLDNTFKQFDHYASAVSKDWIIRGNKVGSMRLSFARNFKIDQNIIDGEMVGNAIPFALQFRSSSHISSFSGNTIKHNAVGISREQTNAVIYLAVGNNNIIAPTPLDNYVANPPNNAEFNLLCGDGFEICGTNFFVNGEKWLRRSGTWAANIASLIYDPPSLAAGASVSVDVGLVGAKVGDVVQASFDKYNVNIDIKAVVSASSKVTVTFKNNGAAAVDLDSGTITVKRN